MRLLVIGGTAGIGRRVVDEALGRGHEVRAMARGAGHLPETERLDRFAGDAQSPDDVARALDGVDAVVQTLGLGRRPRPWQRVTLFSRSTEVLIPAMRRAGISRLVAVTGFGAGDSRMAMSRIERLGHRLALGSSYGDKDVQEALITASGLDWTIVRPTILTDTRRSGRYQILTAGHWRNGMISRAAVADYILDSLEQSSHLREAVVLAR